MQRKSSQCTSVHRIACTSRDAPPRTTTWSGTRCCLCRNVGREPFLCGLTTELSGRPRCRLPDAEPANNLLATKARSTRTHGPLQRVVSLHAEIDHEFQHASFVTPVTPITRSRSSSETQTTPGTSGDRSSSRHTLALARGPFVAALSMI